MACCSSKPDRFLSSAFFLWRFFQIPQCCKTSKMAFGHESQVNQIFPCFGGKLFESRFCGEDIQRTVFSLTRLLDSQI